MTKAIRTRVYLLQRIVFLVLIGILVAVQLQPSAAVRADTSGEFYATPFAAMPRGASSLAATGLPVPQADPPRPRYTITDLGTLGGDTSQAFGINKKGQVVGLAKLNAQIYHAFFWENKVMTDLGTLGGLQSSAQDINDVGHVVGGSHSGNGSVNAFLWIDGVMQNLGTLGGSTGTSATGINNSGQVVGNSSISDSIDPSEPGHAFLWQNGAMQDLGTLGGRQSYATDINNVTQVVGFSDQGDPQAPVTHAFLWQNGTMEDLGSLAGDFSNAYAINNSGQVVGKSLASLVSPFPIHAFLWQNGSMQDLGTLGGNFSYAYDISDSGQIVGYSTNAIGQGRAFLWENGQMKDLNTLIPTDSGWGLASAEGINKRGQIVGNGVINGQAHAYLLTPHLPVLIVPGIAGTYSANTLLNLDYEWLTHRGVHPSELQIDPLGRVYHDLIQTFKNLGYEEGKDLFVVKYDWRLMPGPIDGVFDGYISGLNAQAVADEQFNYAVDYLGYYLRQASEAYRTQYGGILPQVNLISHSTGGLVARSYIQSGAYGGVYDAVNDYHLPEVDQFIMVGVPNRGASKAWNPIHNNWIADPAYRIVLSKIINRAYQKVTAVIGATIQGPDYNIDKAAIMVNGSPNQELFIQKYVPTVSALLATYDFIDFGGGFVNMNDDPALRNNLLLDLNNGLDLVPTADPNPFADHTTTTVMCGASEYTANLVVERTGTVRQDVLLPFSDYIPQDVGASDVWYEDLWLAYGGDQTVPLESCREQFLGDIRIDLRLFTGAQSDHTGLMSNVLVQRAMLDILKVKYQSQNISTGTGANLLNAISVISDPAETMLVDGQGRRLGYSQATGVLTEIPGSVWFGDADGFGLVAGNFVEPLHVDLIGLGEDHYVMVSVERFGVPVGGVVSSGYLAEAQVLNIPIVLTTKYLFLPAVFR